MFQRLRNMAGLLSALAVLLLTTSVWAQRPEPVKHNDPVAQLVATKVISRAEQRAALRLWSRRAIAEAQPLAMPLDTAPAKRDTAAARVEVSGPMGSTSAGLPEPDAEQVARAAYPEDWAILDKNRIDPALASAAADMPAAEAAAEAAKPDAIGPAGTSQVYTAYAANLSAAMQTIYPHAWIGRISFSTPAGPSFCSGTAINGNVMLTAAHCLYDTTNNKWYSKWVFAPAYRNGSAPFGTFAAQQCWVPTGWINQTGNYSISAWARYDVGVCKMGNNSAGRTLNAAVGWMAYQWNAPYVRHFHDLGYPFKGFTGANLPSPGLFLRACVGESFVFTTDTRGMGCSFAGGISGGPWVVGYAPGSVAGYVDGVNSGGFPGTQNIYGARFTSYNIVPLCAAAKC